MGKRERAERELNRRLGMTYNPPGPGESLVNDYEEARQEAPMYRTKTSMQNYLHYRNARRWKRLQEDFAWAKSQLELIPHCNPEDARFLL